MTTHAETSQASAVAQQIEHDETAMHPRQPQPAGDAAAAALGRGAATRRAIRTAIGCLLRPALIDDNNPQASRRPIMIGAVSVAVVAAVSVIATRRARRA